MNSVDFSPAQNLRRLLPVLLLAGAMASNVQAATVIVNNINGPGEGFNDPTPAAPVAGNPEVTIGAQRLAAFQAAADEWAETLVSSVTIVIDAQMTSLSCSENSAVLGSAGPRGFVSIDFAEAPSPDTWYPQALTNALRGFDIDPARSDVGANFNQDIGTPGCLSGLGWSYVIGAPAPGGTIAFTDTVIHEIGHGLGFLSFVDKATGALFAGSSDHYTQYLLDETPDPKLWNDMNDSERAASATDDGNLTWNGPEVAKVAGLLSQGRHPVSNRVQMYAPTVLAGGSSVSHFDTALTPDEIMEPFLRSNSEQRLTNHLMLDIGWTGQTEMAVAIDDGVLDIISGDQTVYVITLDNNGPADLSIVDAPVSSTIPPGLINATWTCIGSGSASCATGSGSSDIATLVTVPVGGSIQIEIEADVDVTFEGLITTTVQIDMPGNILNTVDSTATDETTAILPLSPAVLVSDISNDITEAGGAATFSVVLNTQPGDDVNIPLLSSDEGEGALSDASLTFTPTDWDTPRLVTVTGQDDAVDDGDQLFFVSLAATISADPDYNGLDATNVTVLNLDDDTAGISASLISGDTTEDGGTATFTVVLNSEPTSNVDIGLSSSNPLEGTVLPETLTFTPGDWNTPKEAVVTGVADGVIDTDTAFSIEFAPASSADPLYEGIVLPAVAVINLNVDLPPLVLKDGFEED